jgi:serine/threonine protein kinase
VLRYASLGSVAEHLAQMRDSVAEPYAVARLVRPLLSAVQYLHARGVVHRDVKLENVVVDGESGDAMLVDFGLAADCSAHAPHSRLGTPAYMARAPPVLRWSPWAGARCLRPSLHDLRPDLMACMISWPCL